MIPLDVKEAPAPNIYPKRKKIDTYKDVFVHEVETKSKSHQGALSYTKQILLTIKKASTVGEEALSATAKQRKGH